ncbi:chaperone protein dnaJ [Haematococcus lacustris]|uniref:Chaperone protein dnaJ n=1 Tax=Haematococcus lacustris TaxID=44745 RepID=A0A699ZPD3_HAELA|nr:chaperone protein dnaJ [Haematococcus lacustris]
MQPSRSFAAHYEVLGITEDADAEQVQRAFRRAARTLHPDVNHAPDATQRFQAALAAYEALTDADSRQHYDKGLGLVRADF